MKNFINFIFRVTGILCIYGAGELNVIHENNFSVLDFFALVALVYIGLLFIDETN